MPFHVNFLSTILPTERYHLSSPARSIQARAFNMAVISAKVLIRINSRKVGVKVPQEDVFRISPEKDVMNGIEPLLRETISNTRRLYRLRWRDPTPLKSTLGCGCRVRAARARDTTIVSYGYEFDVYPRQYRFMAWWTTKKIRRALACKVSAKKIDSELVLLHDVLDGRIAASGLVVGRKSLIVG